jgi:hypothetical protein
MSTTGSGHQRDWANIVASSCHGVHLGDSVAQAIRNVGVTPSLLLALFSAHDERTPESTTHPLAGRSAAEDGGGETFLPREEWAKPRRKKVSLTPLRLRRSRRTRPSGQSTSTGAESAPFAEAEAVVLGLTEQVEWVPRELTPKEGEQRDRCSLSLAWHQDLPA